MATQQQTIARLRELRLNVVAATYQLQLEQPKINQVPFDDRFALLVEAEVSERESKRLSRLVRSANLPEPAHLEEIDLRPGRGIDQAYLSALATCEWVRRGQAVILVGPTGVGKTWLGSALMNQACRLRMTCKWWVMSELLEEVSRASVDGSLPKLRQDLIKPQLLALDDFGLGEIDPLAGHLLLQVIDKRQRLSGATLYTSQFPTEKWHGLFPDPSVADAALDRFIHTAHILTLKGESMRKLRAKK
jgi:DNA replication protein DnaC